MLDVWLMQTRWVTTNLRRYVTAKPIFPSDCADGRGCCDAADPNALFVRKFACCAMLWRSACAFALEKEEAVVLAVVRKKERRLR